MRTAVVTGASRGIGRDVAIALARGGFRVGLVARDGDRLAEVARTISSAAVVAPADVTDATAVTAAVAAVEEAFGPPDLLVNNAGIADTSETAAWEADPDDWWRVVETNLRGPYLCSRAVLPGLRERGGRIVNVTGMVQRAVPGYSSYCVAKAALSRLTESLAMDGVKVFDVSPGLVRTELTSSMPMMSEAPAEAFHSSQRMIDFVFAIADGRLDALSGRYFHAQHDDLDSLVHMPTRSSPLTRERCGSRSTDRRTRSPDETRRDSSHASRMDEERVVGDLRELMGIPSVGGSKAETEIQQWCADRLTEMGLDVDHWRIDLDELSKHPDFPGMEVDRDEAWGCVGILGTGRPALILNGHVDVVPAATYEARLENGILHGRGSCDMKGGVAAIINAVQALTRTKLDKAIAVHLVIGEEDGGVGTFATLERGHTGDACLIAEPTAHHIIPANTGSLTFRIEITGKATHGAIRTHGVSAIEKFEIIQAALRNLERRRNTDPDEMFEYLDLANPISIGTVRAGDWASTVPDTLTADGRFGVRLHEPVQQARRELEEAVAAACAGDDWLRDHPAMVTWQGGIFASGALPPNHPLLRQTQQAAGPKAPGVRGGPYGSDLRLYATKNIPTLQYGPGDVRHAHAKDEHVHIEDVLHCARTYARLAEARSR